MSAETRRSIAAALEEPIEALTTESAYPSITPVLYYENPDSIEWLVSVFGLEVRMSVPGPGGQIMHGELTWGDGLIMIGVPIEDEGWSTPKLQSGAITQSVYVMVDDVDSHFDRVKSAGGEPQSELQDVHGQRRYRILDPEGHLWWFVQDIA